jgi:hypothetical protein
MCNAGIVGHHEADPRFLVQAPDDLLRPAFQHLDHSTFGTPALIRAADAHGNAIAVHDFTHLAVRQHDGRRTIVGMQEAVSIAVAADSADNERQALAQAVFLTPIAQQLAPMEQCFDLL